MMLSNSEVERLRYSLIQSSINFMAEISDESLENFSRVEKKRIAWILEAPVSSLIDLDVMRGNSRGDRE